jgi:hypothetical protein
MIVFWMQSAAPRQGIINKNQIVISQKGLSANLCWDRSALPNCHSSPGTVIPRFAAKQMKSSGTWFCEAGDLFLVPTVSRFGPGS